ncbi:MAG: hypothetical protein Q4C12_03265 [Clostridia bacterium]|nr:hypothetical protein [Clostridia bacterium]
MIESIESFAKITMLNFSSWGAVGFLSCIIAEFLPYIFALLKKNENGRDVLKFSGLAIVVTIFSALIVYVMFICGRAWVMAELVVSVIGMAGSLVLWLIALIKAFKG